MAGGYVLIHRGIMDLPSWTAEPFTRGQAWIDLIMLANYKDGSITVRGNYIPVKRGQVGRSIVNLADRWTWSRGKVKRYLDELEIGQQIEQQKNKLCTLITLTNYESYQAGRTPDSATDGQKTDIKRYNRQSNRRGTNKQGNKENKGNKQTKAQPQLVPALPDWLDKQAWEDFKQHRVDINKKLTAVAEKRIIKKLSDHVEDHKQMIDNAITNRWTDVYPLKKDQYNRNDEKDGPRSPVFNAGQQ